MTWLVYLFCDFARQEPTEHFHSQRPSIWNSRRISHHKENKFQSLFTLPQNRKIHDVQQLLLSIVFIMHNENVYFMDYDMLTDRLRWTSSQNIFSLCSDLERRTSLFSERVSIWTFSNKRFPFFSWNLSLVSSKDDLWFIIE